MWTHLKEQKFYSFELFVLTIAIGSSVSSISINLLIQDKICLSEYNQSATFCQRLNNQMITASDTDVKDHILAESAYFNNYL